MYHSFAHPPGKPLPIVGREKEKREEVKNAFRVSSGHNSPRIRTPIKPVPDTALLKEQDHLFPPVL